MSLENVIEENTAALREFIVYIKLALDAARMASVSEVRRQTQAGDDKAKLQQEAIDKQSAINLVTQDKFDKVKNDFATPEEFHKYAHDTLAAEMEKAARYLEADAKKLVAEAPPKVTADVLPVIESAAPVMHLTLAEVGLAITAVAKLDRAKVVRVLAEFGCMRGSDLTADQYADFVKALS